MIQSKEKISIFSVNRILNRLYQFTKIMYAVAIFLTYNLQFYVPYTLLWPRISRILSKYGENTINKCEHAFRIGLILITCKFDQIDSTQSI